MTSQLTKSNATSQQDVKVVLFSGGRGSSALAKQLITQKNIQLSLLVNGYDDGLSTGEVRRFLGDCLGPSDFRKNATRMAATLESCNAQLIEILDLRFPEQIDQQVIDVALDILIAKENDYKHPFIDQLNNYLDCLDEATSRSVKDRMQAFLTESKDTGKEFNYLDCSIGNLVFAGSFLLCQRDFNKAVADYAGLLGLTDDLILNVTNGENVFLVAINSDGEFLASEAEIVDATRRNHIADIYLIDSPLTERQLVDCKGQALVELLQEKQADLSLSPQAQLAISQADIIVYAPGTQHSSLLPSYITPKLGETIANNAKALKLLITNLQEDAEIPDAQATDIIDKAVYYLREQGQRNYPASSLVTHYLINDPDQSKQQHKYIPIGDLTGVEDPRAFKISNFEHPSSGQHDADKIITPFINSVIAAKQPLSIAVLLLQNSSNEKTVQTIMDMSRVFTKLEHKVCIYYRGEKIDYLHELDLPFSINCISPNYDDAQMAEHALQNGYDYICMMEGSGMYHGYDVLALLVNLDGTKVDAVWGSRRLSVADVKASYRFRYQHNWLLGGISYIGSHVLSIIYLMLYGHFISDTLSGLRVVRSEFLRKSKVSINHASFNQYLLCDLLNAKGRVFEVPVDFLPMSPDKVKRTSVLQGVQNLLVVFVQRIKNLFDSEAKAN